MGRFIFILLSISGWAAASTIDNVKATGLYNANGTWSTNAPAGAGNTVSYNGSFTLTLNTAASIQSITIGSGDVLTNSTGTNETLTVGNGGSGGVTLSGGTLSASSGNLTVANKSGTGLGLTNINSGTFSGGTLQSGGSSALIVLPANEGITTIGSSGAVVLSGTGAVIRTGSANALASLGTLQGILSLQSKAVLSTAGDTNGNLNNSGTLIINGASSKLTVSSGFGNLLQTSGATSLTNSGAIAGNVSLSGGSFTAGHATISGTFANSATGTGGGLIVNDNSSAANALLTVGSDFTEAGGNLTFGTMTGTTESTINATDFIFNGAAPTVTGIGKLEQGGGFAGITDLTSSVNLYADANDYADFAFAQPGYLTIESGATLTVHNYTQSSNSELTLSGTIHAIGSINVTSAYSLLGNGVYDSPQTTVAPQTGLTGSPSFTGNLTFDGQFSTDAYWNGNATATINIGGNFVMGSKDPLASDINMQVDSLSSYDDFRIAGTATIDGGYLDVNMCSIAATPTSFTKWDLIHAAGGITGTFLAEGPTFGCTMPTGYSFVQSTNDIYLEYTPAVPEPSSGLLVCAVIVLLMARTKAARRGP